MFFFVIFYVGRLTQWDNMWLTELKGCQFELHQFARPGWALGLNLIMRLLVTFRLEMYFRVCSTNNFFITYFFSVSLKFWSCYVTVEWGNLKVKNGTLCLDKLSWFFFLLLRRTVFSFSFNFCNEQSNFRNRILTNDIPE